MKKNEESASVAIEVLEKTRRGPQDNTQEKEKKYDNTIINS